MSSDPDDAVPRDAADVTESVESRGERLDRLREAVIILQDKFADLKRAAEEEADGQAGPGAEHQ